VQGGGHGFQGAGSDRVSGGVIGVNGHNGLPMDNFLHYSTKVGIFQENAPQNPKFCGASAGLLQGF
jgi:hypothetical protein